jgi:hypothetical protein
MAGWRAVSLFNDGAPNYRSEMQLYRIFLTRDGHICGPAMEHVLPDDTAALLATLDATSAETGAEAWEDQRLVVMLLPMRPTVPRTPAQPDAD